MVRHLVKNTIGLQHLTVENISVRMNDVRMMLEWIDQFFCSTCRFWGCSCCKKYLNKHRLYAYFISNTFVSNTKLELAKNPAKANQHTESKLLLFENYYIIDYNENVGENEK